MVKYARRLIYSQYGTLAVAFQSLTPMPFSATLIQENAASRERLRALFSRLTDSQYNLSLDADWTVGTALAHVAFFDCRAFEILQQWERAGVAPSPNDVDIINAALVPFLRELSPSSISKLVLESAEKLDTKLAALSDSVLDQFDTVVQHPFNLSRAKHRNEHIDQIEHATKS